MKCKSCGKEGAVFDHFDGGKVCENCIGSYFSCPTCGTAYNQDDYENADGGSGHCVKCTREKVDI